jgi:hypothetical protein
MLVPSLPPLSTCWFLLSLRFQHTGSFSPSTFNTLVPSLPLLSMHPFLISLCFQHTGSSIYLYFLHVSSFSFFAFNTLILLSLPFLHTGSFYPSTFYAMVPSSLIHSPFNTILFSSLLLNLCFLVSSTFPPSLPPFLSFFSQFLPF